MEAALVSVSTGVLKPLLSKLTKLLGEEYGKLKGVRKQIKFLRDELSAMSPTLEMLADAEQLDPQMRAWRDKLRELSYDLEDCIDAFMARVDHQRDGGFIKRFFDKLKKLKPRHEIANQIQELKASVIDASERHKRYQLANISSNSRSTSSVDPRLSALYVEIDKLVGIDGPKKHVIEWLAIKTNKASSSELNVLSIVGSGGLGKTTLANQVYQDVKSQFDCAAFASVSRTPDIKKILRGIAKGVGITSDMLYDDEKELIDKLREHLQDKRYLIVIDDLWDAKPWETIKFALINKNSDSRVITTTRSNGVASYLSSQGGNVYQMKSLSFEDSKRLLFRRAFGCENLCYTHLGSAPDEILRKCDGLPLAIVTISSMLTDQHAKSEWDTVLNDIGSALAKNPGAENMTTILSMSYFDIPHKLRTCLLYLSVYPEDYYIEKQCLINRWIAEGFILEEQGQTKYEIGEGYFNDLINRSMIQPVKVKYGQAKACRVHDIILDYIKCKAIEENFVTSVDAAEPAYTSEYNKVRRLCVSNHNENNVTIWEDQILCQVRSVTIFGDPMKISLLPSSLRVLDLGDCRDMEDLHLASIGNLINLKYLCVHSNSIKKLPDNVGELQYLQTLDVRGTDIKELPPSITKLQQLAHLYVDWDTTFSEGTIGEMHALEELRTYRVRSYERGKSILEFSKLTKLRTLKIEFNFELPDGSEGRNQAEDIHNYLGNLLSSCNLHNLDILIRSVKMWYPLSLHSWHPAASCSICKLCIKEIPIYRVPNWMGSLGSVRVLELTIFCVRPEDVEILGEIPSLFVLNLVTIGGSSGRIVFPCSGFRSLKYFSMNIYLSGTSLEFQAGSMSKLERVRLEFNVHEMECLNGASSLGIQHLSSLNKVEIKINSDRDGYYGNYNPAEDDHDDTVRCISRAINAAIETLPNRPIAMFERACDNKCIHFETALRELNQMWELNEWLKLWQIREEPEATDAETEQEVDTHKNEEEEQIEDDEETSGKEVAQQDDSGCSN